MQKEVRSCSSTLFLCQTQATSQGGTTQRGPSAKTYRVFRFSVFQKLFPIAACHMLSPQSAAAFSLPHGSSPRYHQAALHQISPPSPQHNCNSHFMGSFSTSSKHSCQFLSLLPTPHTCPSGALSLRCPEFGFLPSAAISNSYTLSRKISENQDYVMLPSP